MTARFDPDEDVEGYVRRLLKKGFSPRDVRMILVEEGGVSDTEAMRLVRDVTDRSAPREAYDYAVWLFKQGKSSKTIRRLLVEDMGMNAPAARRLVRDLRSRTKRRRTGDPLPLIEQPGLWNMLVGGIIFLLCLGALVFSMLIGNLIPPFALFSGMIFGASQFALGVSQLARP
jgi:hypothetical protein